MRAPVPGRRTVARGRSLRTVRRNEEECVAHGPDSFVSSARSSAEEPQLIGQRVDAARAYAA